MMRSVKRSRSVLVLRAALAAALLVIGLVPAARTDAQVADGTVVVDVVDETGAPLPGVSVVLKRPDTGFSRTAVTGASGAARVSAVPPASYEVEVALQGFETVSEKSVVLRVGQTARLRIVLRTSKTESITVTAEAPLVDVFKTDSSSNVVPEQIEALPVQDRDFQKLAFIAPGVQRERGAFRFVTNGPVIGAGGNASQSTILVDGVDYTDPALGLAKTRFSQDAIAEFRVINSRFDTEVGGSAGGALSIVTKSGTNEFHGSAFGYYRAEGLRAKGALERESTIDFHRGQYGFTLGGPVVHDQTHFFGSFEYIDQTTPILFRPGGAYQSRAEDIEHPLTQTLGFLGFDQRMSDSGRLTARVDVERYREENFRVGGVADVSYGQRLDRDNLNLTLGYTDTFSSTLTNELRGQVGKRKFFEPANSTGPAEWFTNGVTLQTGGNILGDLLGDGNQWELKDTLYKHVSAKSGSHELKLGVGVLHVNDRSRIDTYATGLLLYANDVPGTPALYLYGEGSSDVKTNTTRLSGFLQDDWRPLSNLTVTLGVRYDWDSNGNNPDFTHPLVPEGRGTDKNNVQPRLGFSWDVAKDGENVVRGGWGIFTGRYLLVPAEQELALNGVTGRRLRTRVSLPGLLIDRNNPASTGFLLPSIDIAIMDTELQAPEARQASLGFTRRLGSTGLYVDLEGVWVKGKNETIIRDKNWRGNATPTRIYPQYGQVNTYTDEGRSEYKAVTLSVNGTIKGGHIVTSSVTFGDKKNISDDFSPEFPTGYPNDPANIEAEYGRARSYERVRVVMSGVFRLPWQVTVAPIFEYGSGQPWTHRLGYDFNGDGKNSDRPAGADRFGEDGPPFRQLSLRLTKGVELGRFGRLDVIAECFNVFDSTNYDVSTINAGEYLAGPTLAAPTRAYVANPLYRTYSATLSPREIQLGLRYSF